MYAINARHLRSTNITINNDYGRLGEPLKITLSSNQSKSIKCLEILSYGDIRLDNAALYRFLSTLLVRMPSLQHLCILKRIGLRLFFQLLTNSPELDEWK